MEELHEKKQILHEISKASDAIRRKHKMLKLGREASEKYSSEIFKPIVTPLQKLVNQQQVKPEVKQEIKNEPEVPTMKEDDNDSFDDDGNQTVKYRSFLDESFQPNETLATSSPLYSRKYLQRLNRKKDFQGARYEVRKLKKGLMFGNSDINFDGEKIKVGNNSYTETPGLVELLFNKSINEPIIKEDDVENYLKIIESTNAHRNYFQPNGHLRDDNSLKYKKYISSYVESLNKTGEGLPQQKVARKNTKFDYVYWDDPNELVDRLRLLVASQAAGNPSHTNEIISIIEELREAEIIY